MDIKIGRIERVLIVAIAFLVITLVFVNSAKADDVCTVVGVQDVTPGVDAVVSVCASEEYKDDFGVLRALFTENYVELMVRSRKFFAPHQDAIDAVFTFPDGSSKEFILVQDYNRSWTSTSGLYHQIPDMQKMFTVDFPKYREVSVTFNHSGGSFEVGTFTLMGWTAALKKIDMASAR